MVSPRQASLQIPDYAPSYPNTGTRNASAPTASSDTTLNKPPLTLVVDDFGIKYSSETNIQHFIAVVRKLYTVTIEKSGTLYCGLTMKWDYKRRHVNISMPEYIEHAFAKFLDYTITQEKHSLHP